MGADEGGEKKNKLGITARTKYDNEDDSDDDEQ